MYQPWYTCFGRGEMAALTQGCLAPRAKISLSHIINFIPHILLCVRPLSRFLTYVKLIFNTNFEFKYSKYISNIYFPVKRTQYHSEIMDKSDRNKGKTYLEDLHLIYEWTSINNDTFWVISIIISCLWSFVLHVVKILRVTISPVLSYNFHYFWMH